MARPNRLELARRRFLALLGLAPAIAAIPPLQAGPSPWYYTVSYSTPIWDFQPAWWEWLKTSEGRAATTIDTAPSRPVTQA